MNNKYEIILYWDKTDNIYIAEVPELPGCMAHGETEETALSNVKEAILLWIETAIANDEPVPVPKGEKLLFA
jgi:predicted RNase H-like HicB family nuclease